MKMKNNYNSFRNEYFDLLDELTTKTFYRLLNQRNYNESMFEKLVNRNEHDLDSLEVLCNVGTD